MYAQAPWHKWRIKWFLEWLTKIRIKDDKRGAFERPGSSFPHLLTQFHSLTPGHPEDKFRQRRCGALPVHPSSSHHPALPGLSAAFPVPPLQGPTAPGPGFQHRPLRAPTRGRGDWLPARLTLDRGARLRLRSSARGGSPPLRVFTALLWRGHQESCWGRWPKCGPSGVTHFTWTERAKINCSWRPFKTQLSTLIGGRRRTASSPKSCRYSQADSWTYGTS